MFGNENITLMVDLVVCLALAVTVVVAKIVGCLLPIGAGHLAGSRGDGKSLHFHHCGCSEPAGVLPVRQGFAPCIIFRPVPTGTGLVFGSFPLLFPVVWGIMQLESCTFVIYKALDC